MYLIFTQFTALSDKRDEQHGYWCHLVMFAIVIEHIGVKMVIFPKQRIKLPELVNLSTSFHKGFLLTIILYSIAEWTSVVIRLVNFEEEASLAKLFSCVCQTILF